MSRFDVLRILQDGDPILREVADPIVAVDDTVSGLASAMLRTMFAARGIGLAAPQVGVLQRLIVVGIDGPSGPTYAMVNPRIVDRSDTLQRSVEGCLSVPQRRWGQVIDRALRVKVEYVDLAGETRRLKARGLFAAVIQHEIDHLDGVLFTDYLRGAA